MSSVFKNLEKIVTGYFDKEFVSEYKLSFKISRVRKTSIKDAGNQEQLNAKILQSGEFQSRVDLLLTVSQARLDTFKYVEFLLHLGEFAVSQGEFGTALQIYERVTRYAGERNGFESFSAYAFMAIGDLYSRQADWQNAITFIEKASELFEQQKDHKGLSRCENILGTIYGDRGDTKQSQLHFEKSLSYLDPGKDDAIIGMLEINLGVLSNIQGNYDLSLTYYQRALIKYEKIQDLRRLAEIKNNLGVLYTHKCEFDIACLEYDKSLTISISINYLYALAISYLGKAYIYTQTSDLVLAQAFADKAMDTAFKINDRLSIADIYKIKGIIDRSLKKYSSAENYFMTSLRINQELENLINEAETCYEISLLYIETGRKSEARDHLDTALGNYKKINNLVMMDKIKKTHQTILQ